MLGSASCDSKVDEMCSGWRLVEAGVIFYFIFASRPPTLHHTSPNLDFNYLPSFEGEVWFWWPMRLVLLFLKIKENKRTMRRHGGAIRILSLKVRPSRPKTSMKTRSHVSLSRQNGKRNKRHGGWRLTGDREGARRKWSNVVRKEDSRLSFQPSSFDSRVLSGHFQDLDFVGWHTQD